MTIIDRTMMAPTDRSMPAVRMTSVWPTREGGDDRGLLEQEQIELALQERGLTMEKTMNVDDQQEQRAQPRVAVEQVLDPLGGGLLPPRELGLGGALSSAVRRGGRAHEALPQQIFEPSSVVML